MAESISVIGAGSWGTALAKLLAEKGNKVLMWAFEKEVSDCINREHRNPLYLSDVALPKDIRATSAMEGALSGRTFCVSAVPSHAARKVWKGLATHLDPEAILISCTKGIEENSLKLISQVLSECLPGHPMANRTVLSGPSFAKEVAQNLPTQVVVAGGDSQVRKRVQEMFHTDSFVAFSSDDVIGVEVGGAIKNVIAIAAGVSDGLGLGHNTRAAMITRGLYEMIKIGKELGANPLTFAGLSGIGDLVLTCTADLSRNHTVGKELGQGHTLDEICRGMKMVAEGISTAKAAHGLATRHGIRAPICEVVYRIVFEGLCPQDAIEQLYALPLKDELGAIIKGQ